MKWIPVSERLPDFDTLVLGYAKKVGYFVCVLSERDETDNGRPCWNAFNNVSGVGHVEPYTLEYEDEWPTHWQPIPPAPGKEPCCGRCKAYGDWGGCCTLGIPCKPDFYCADYEPREE